MKIDVVSVKEKKSIGFKEEKTLLDVLRKNDIFINATCGGNGTCGKCKVRIIDNIPDVNKTEVNFLTEEEIKDGVRLACLHKPKNGMVIEVDNKREYNIVADFNLKNLAKKSNYGFRYAVAIDIGTTTVVVVLIDMYTSKVISIESFVNPQQKYGADVISRINYFAESDSEVQTDVIKKYINNSINKCCAKSQIDINQIEKIVISGNTTMQYLFQGFDPFELSVAPFNASKKQKHRYNYEDIFNSKIDCEVIVLPSISAYIGADIVSGMFYLKDDMFKHKSILIDLGTNGEIVLFDGENIYCASTAAGPALEGASIKDGVGGVEGAISNFQIKNNISSFSTIGDVTPIGICGSGIIDIMAELLKNEYVDVSGRFEKGEFKITNNISFYQKDIREVQLAKSAIRSGIEVLLNEANLKEEEIEYVYIAGGFGKHINIEKAAIIGIISKKWLGKTKVIGNSSLGGAIHYLFDKDADIKIDKLIDDCIYIELSLDERFNKYFIENIGF